MKFLKFILAILIIFTFNISKADEIKIQNKITKNLRCLICQGQSVYDSDSEFAISLKLVVKNKIEEGFTEDQIYKFLTKKYGEWILYGIQANGIWTDMVNGIQRDKDNNGLPRETAIGMGREMVNHIQRKPENGETTEHELNPQRR